jgi:hypothetical protein
MNGLNPAQGGAKVFPVGSAGPDFVSPFHQNYTITIHQGLDF